MDEEILNQVLQQANIALEDNERKIDNLPSYLVYYCRREGINDLILHLKSYIDSLYPLFQGTEEKTREMILKCIELAEREIEAAKVLL